MAAAILLHAAVVAWFLLSWEETPQEPPKPVAVTLIMVAPPEPAPAPAPEPPRAFAARRSGKDERTTAPPPAEAPAPMAAAPEPPKIEAPPVAAATPEPPPPAPPEPKAAEPPPPPATASNPQPQPQPKPQPPQRLARLEPHKDAVAHAPILEPHLGNPEIGEREQNGDPYLNRVWALIDRHRKSTTPIGSSGLRLAGTTVFAVVVERSGTVRSVSLARSSGSEQLDDEARAMINSAAPLPPLPPDYPAPIRIVVTISLYPQ